MKSNKVNEGNLEIVIIKEEPSLLNKRFLEVIIGVTLESMVENVNVTASFQWSHVFFERFPLGSGFSL